MTILAANRSAPIRSCWGEVGGVGGNRNRDAEEARVNRVVLGSLVGQSALKEAIAMIRRTIRVRVFAAALIVGMRALVGGGVMWAGDGNAGNPGVMPPNSTPLDWS
jgi:hypothetical protein